MYILLIALAAAAVLSIQAADPSSADPDHIQIGFCNEPGKGFQTYPAPSEPPMQGMAPQDGHDDGFREKAVINPGQPGTDPMDMILGFEKVSAEKKELESRGMEVLVKDIPTAPDDKDVYETIKDIIGRDSFVIDVPDDGTVETVDIYDIDDTMVDDDFLMLVADALDDAYPELSECIRSVLELRQQIILQNTVQEFISSTSTSDRKDDADCDEDEDPVAEIVEEESADEEPVKNDFEETYASCDTVHPVFQTVTATECPHGAADGPAL